jgi:hypothetical protein
MAEPILDNQVCTVKAYCYLDGQVSINQYHWRMNNPVGVPTYEGFLAALSPLMGISYATILPTVAEYLGLSLQLRLPTARQSISTALGAQVGGDASIPLPKQASVIVTKKTGIVVASRRNRGRIYLPFPPVSADEGNGVPTAVYRGLANSFGLAYLSDSPGFVCDLATTIDLTPVILDGTPAGGTPVIVTEFAVGRRFATSPRRGDYAKLNRRPVL